MYENHRCLIRNMLAYVTSRFKLRPDISNKMKFKNIFIRCLPLRKFLAKYLRVNKITMKNFFINLSFLFDCRSRHSINAYRELWCGFIHVCTAYYLCIKLIRTQHKWCEMLGCNPDWRVVMNNYVCMYVKLKIAVYK